MKQRRYQQGSADCDWVKSWRALLLSDVGQFSLKSRGNETCYHFTLCPDVSETLCTFIKQTSWWEKWRRFTSVCHHRPNNKPRPESRRGFLGFFPPTSLIYWTKRWCSLHLSWDITVSLECDEVRHLCDLRRPCSRPLKFSTGLSSRK